jgi:hypothetical protein
VHHALRDALVVEVSDLLAQMVVLEEHRSARSGGQGVVGVLDRYALCGRQALALLAVQVGFGRPVVRHGPT